MQKTFTQLSSAYAISTILLLNDRNVLVFFVCFYAFN